MNNGRAILGYLKFLGIKNIFGIPSGTICPIVDSFNDVDDINFIIPKNEATATYSATKAAVLSGKLQVCLMSGAVGIGNALNGIMESRVNGIPLLIISGAPKSENINKGAMQETLASDYINNLVVYNEFVQEDVISHMKNAIESAINLKGPAHIELPMDYLKEEFEEIEFSRPEIMLSTLDIDMIIKEILPTLENERGVIIVGEECKDSAPLIKLLATKLKWYIMTTTGGKSVIEEDFPYNLGNFGFPSTDMADKIMSSDDYKNILALGTKLQENDTNGFDSILKTKNIIKVSDRSSDCYYDCKDIKTDVEQFLKYVVNNVKPREDSLDTAYDLNDKATYELDLSIRYMYENITKCFPKDTIYINDIGSSWVYANKFLNIPPEGEYACDVYHAAMGSSVGYIGACVEFPEREVVVFTGDGSFFMNHLSELLTAKKYNLNVTIIVFNNSTLGYVSKGHENIFGRTLEEFESPIVNIKGIVESMGIETIQVHYNSEIDNLWYLTENKGLKVVELYVDISEPMPGKRFKSLKLA